MVARSANSTVTAPAKGACLMVANYAPDVGYAWWLMEHYWALLAENLARQGRRALLAYPSRGEIPPAIQAAPIDVIWLDFGDRSDAGWRALSETVRREGVTSLYLTDRAYARLALCAVATLGCREHSRPRSHARRSAGNRWPQGLDQVGLAAFRAVVGRPLRRGERLRSAAHGRECPRAGRIYGRRAERRRALRVLGRGPCLGPRATGRARRRCGRRHGRSCSSHQGHRVRDPCGPCRPGRGSRRRCLRSSATGRIWIDSARWPRRRVWLKGSSSWGAGGRPTPDGGL